jgi:hypothetical protein
MLYCDEMHHDRDNTVYMEGPTTLTGGPKAAPTS